MPETIDVISDGDSGQDVDSGSTDEMDEMFETLGSIDSTSSTSSTVSTVSTGSTEPTEPTLISTSTEPETVKQSTPSRRSRVADMRDLEKRVENWTPGSNLPTPDPREGLEFRYVRATTRGVLDNVNLSKAFRDYWEPVLSSEYPELRVMSDRGSEFPDGVVIGGLVLCSRPKEFGDKMREIGDRELREQMRAVDQNYFNEPSGGMTKFSDKSTRVNQFSNG